MWPQSMVGQEGKPVRVYVVDDDNHIRRVIAQELMSDPRTLLVGQAASLREARKHLNQQPFDVLLVDLNLGDGEGLELIGLAQTLNPDALIVVVSVTERDDKVLQAFELGAMGYLLKNSLFGDYVQAVLQVANGGASITPSLARKLLSHLDKSHARPFASVGTLQEERLSARESEVLKLVAGGYTSSEIGTQLGISTLTVNTHIKSIYRKLQARTRAQAVRAASLRGLFS
ncbi:response regulator [Comamonas aquatilis]|uniref:response regulator n=1 Tax=Comamonas aquatilis TaxID=1778406 RepID=UPI0039EF468A